MRKLTCKEVREQWSDYNKWIFQGRLRSTKFYITSYVDGSEEGWIWQRGHRRRVEGIGLNCAFLDSVKWKEVLLHEMVHQWEWEVEHRQDDWQSHERFPKWQRYITELGYDEQIQ